jgi:hypothetical protein
MQIAVYFLLLKPGYDAFPLLFSNGDLQDDVAQWLVIRLGDGPVTKSRFS